MNQPKNKNQERSGSRLDSLSKQLPTTKSLATIGMRKAENQKQVKQSAYIIINKKILRIASLKTPTFKQVYIHYFAVQLYWWEDRCKTEFGLLHPASFTNHDYFIHSEYPSINAEIR